MKFKFTFFLLLTVFIAVAQDSMTYIHAGHLLDTKNGEWQNQMTITVKNDRVSKVEKGFKDVPEDGTYINLKDKWVMPGFTDMHVHMETEYNPHAYVQNMWMIQQMLPIALSNMQRLLYYLDLQL
ncbi:Xaa-pro dipeptidase family enzyme [Nonlabens ulvanivorans]|uniref:Xaa-pro dipeptidase family enzyme n=1 Tax=Nonlabens ulvanivorans TaxID=906888 RepID=A0A090WDY5_NONUL|nr:Xaa-pro dipeptidase family enzyme [Nonlabens ulvanivorans]